MRHQLCDQLDGGTQADTQQTDQVRVLHASHDQGLLNETDTHSGMWGKDLGQLILQCYLVQGKNQPLKIGMLRFEKQ